MRNHAHARASIFRQLLLTTALVVLATPLVSHAAGEPAAASLPGASPIDPDAWPQWRGHASNSTGGTGKTFPKGFVIRERWRYELGSGYSGVVIAEGYAVTMFSDGRHDFVAALDAHTGVEAWRVPLAITFPGREGAVDGPVSTPAIDDGRAFALGPRGHLVAVELTTGRVAWQHDLAAEIGAPVPHWGFGTSLVIAGDLLLVSAGGSDGRLVTAFDTRTGVEVWKAGENTARIQYPSPMVVNVAGELQILVSSDTVLLGLEPTTGNVLWSHEHGGASMYGGILNPVAVGDDRFFLNLRPRESEMIKIGPVVDGKAVTTEWKTAELQRNYATPLYHDGYVYGFNASYLSCIDATTGELAWKSRPPGNGWPIMVDGHLVTVTKNGTLHVAGATPDGYQDIAEIEAFDRLVWTPPSFAYGRIYARDSFSQIAAFDIVPADGRDSGRQHSNRELADSRFSRWARELQTASDRAERVRKFLEENPESPIVEDGRFVHFVFQGEADDLAVRGDLLKARREHTLTRVDLGPDVEPFFHASLELERDARINYQFIRNLSEVITDPRNPNPSRALTLRGATSHLAMPGAPPLEDVRTRPEPAQKGRVDKFEFTVEAERVGKKDWGGKREINVYLPPGYDDSEEAYPTVYVLYGQYFLQFAEFDKVLDQLTNKSIQPLIVVFVQATSGYELARSQRGVHTRMLAEKLLPEIDAKYRTLRSPEHRVLAGFDEAGYGAMYTALRYPHLFGGVMAQSVMAVGAGDRQMLDAIEMVPREPVRVFLDWGRYDTTIPSDGTDVPGFSRRLRDTLIENGYSVEGGESATGPDILVLSSRLRKMLENWFPPE